MSSFTEELRRRKEAEKRSIERQKELQKKEYAAIDKINSQVNKIVSPILETLGRELWGRGLLSRNYDVFYDLATFNIGDYRRARSNELGLLPGRWVVVEKPPWGYSHYSGLSGEGYIWEDRDDGRHRYTVYHTPTEGYSVNIAVTVPEQLRQKMIELGIYAMTPDCKPLEPTAFIVNMSDANIRCDLSREQLQKAILTAGEPIRLYVAHRIKRDSGTFYRKA